jgi:thiamine-phosphate pyrophosphorylase
VSTGRIRGLYALTPDMADTDRLAALVAAALEGGVRLVQYRNKVASPALKLEQAAALKAVCRTHDAALIVNDHVDLAVATDADGVHLGREDAALAGAREALGPGKLIGISCYRDIERARSAQHDGAD